MSLADRVLVTEEAVARLYNVRNATQHYRVLKEKGLLHILEPFCGTGRIFIPLALDGHTVVGFDNNQGMLDRAKAKIASLNSTLRFTLSKMNALTSCWPLDFDLVLLGGNFLYELATPEEQKLCLSKAYHSLKPGGYTYIDSDHMEGGLADSWKNDNSHTSYTSPDGTILQSNRKAGSAMAKIFVCHSERHLERIALPSEESKF